MKSNIREIVYDKTKFNPNEINMDTYKLSRLISGKDSVLELTPEHLLPNTLLPRMKRFRCKHCGASLIWLHNWAVAFGDCEGKLMADYQRNISLEDIEKRYAARVLPGTSVMETGDPQENAI